MAKNYELYGFTQGRLEPVKVALESALGVVLERRDSAYRGGEYFRYGVANGDEFILQRNRGEVSEEWAEDEFQEYPTLLYATREADDEKVSPAMVLIGGELLRRQVL